MEKWHIVAKTNINCVELRGKSTDIAELPTDVEIGSTAYCMDNGALYMFDGSDWLKQ